MSTNVGYATVSVIGSAKGFGSGLSRQINPQLHAAGQSGSGIFSNALKMGALAGAAVIAGGVAAILTTGIGEAMDASAGTAQLTAGIKSTGNAAGVTVKDLNALATSIQGYSGQTDDSIVKSEQLLLTFTNIRNSGPNKIFDLATKASADMAAKMGGDASANAVLLGKALNDPVKGISALTRVGVAFTDGQKETIKAMVASGDTMGAQKIILKELNTEFGGAAKAAGDSLPGMLNKAKRAFEDVSQSIVETILPLVLPALKSLAEIITTKVMPAVQGFLEDFKNGVGPAGALRDVLEGVGKVLSFVAGFIASTSGFLIPFAGAILAVVAGIKIWTGVQAALNIVMSANPIGLVVIAVAALVAGIIYAYQNFETFRNIVNAVWSSIQVVVGAVVGFFQTIILPAISFVVDAIALYFKTMFTAYKIVWDAVWTVVETVVNWFRDTIAPAFKKAIDAISGFFGKGIEGIKGIWNGIFDFFSGLVGKWLAIGTAIVDGIRQGISNAWEAFKGWVGGLFGGIVDSVKGVFGIHSPSRVFAGIGVNIVEGLRSGLTGLDPLAAETMKKFEDMTAVDVASSMRMLVSTPSIPGSLDFASTAERSAAITSASNDALIAEMRAMREGQDALAAEFRRQTDTQVSLKRQGAL